MNGHWEGIIGALVSGLITLVVVWWNNRLTQKRDTTTEVQGDRRLQLDEFKVINEERREQIDRLTAEVERLDRKVTQLEAEAEEERRNFEKASTATHLREANLIAAYHELMDEHRSLRIRAEDLERENFRLKEQTP